MICIGENEKWVLVTDGVGLPIAVGRKVGLSITLKESSNLRGVIIAVPGHNLSTYHAILVFHLALVPS